LPEGTPINQLAKTAEKATSQIRSLASLFLEQGLGLAIFQFDQSNCGIDCRVDLRPSEVGTEVPDGQFTCDMGWNDSMDRVRKHRDPID
jgi:hypothetical protein